MTENEEHQPKKLSPLRAAQAVFWSFFGVRRSKDHATDFAQLTLVQIVVSGIIGGILFVLTLLMLVRYVLR